MTTVFSSSPISSTASSRRPTFQSVFSWNPAYTSICRAYSVFSSSESESQAGSASGLGVSSASGGITPSVFCRSKVSSRSLSQPWSNLPRYFSLHSTATWCGACEHPVE